MWGGALGNHQSRATHFTALCLCVGEGLREGRVLLPGFWRFAWHSPHFQSLHPLPVCSRHPSAFALVLNPRVSGFAYILSLCGTFKVSLLKTQQFLPLPQPPLVFTAGSYGDLSPWHWNPGLYGLAWGYDPSLPRYPF